MPSLTCCIHSYSDVGVVRHPQDGQFAQPRRQCRVEQQMHVEPQERLRQVGMVDEGAEDIARVLRGAPLLGKHHGERAVDGVVPLVRGQRGQSHGLSSRL